MKKLMEYKIISGRTVETRRSWLSIGPTYKRPRGTRRAGSSSLKKIKANERERIKILARLINCNFGAGDGFLTLKYDDPHYPADLSYETASEILTKFIRKLRTQFRKETGKALSVISVTANWSPHRQAPARLHHHIVIPSAAVELARKIWPQFGGAGTVIVKDMNDEGDYTNLAAYLIENVHNRPAGEYPKAMMTGQQMEKDTATVNCGGEFSSSMFSKEISKRVMDDKRFVKFLDECCGKAKIEKKCYMGCYAYQIRIDFYPF